MEYLNYAGAIVEFRIYMQRERQKFNTVRGNYVRVVLLKQIGLLFIFFFAMARPMDGQEPDVDQLDTLSPQTGLVGLQQLVDSVHALVAQHRYRAAYEQLRQIRADSSEIGDFNLSPSRVERDIQSVLTKVLDGWSRWSVQRCREAAEHRLRQSAQYIENGQAHLAYRQAIEAKLLLEQTSVNADLIRQANEQIDRVQEQTSTDLLAIEAMVNHQVYGLLLELSSVKSSISDDLRKTLQTQYNLTWDSLKVLTEAAKEQFMVQHAELFPARREIGEIFRDCTKCPQMIVVPSGLLTMGSPNHEDGRDDDEFPRHNVNISYWLAVGVYEVTFTEWDACVSAGGCRDNVSDYGWGRGNRPVIDVSWDDAQSYVSWLSNLTGHEYGLLHESEWEYVARGTTQTARYWGESSKVQCRYANGADRTTRWYESLKGYESLLTVAACDDGYYHTSPVGNYEANKFGLYDVLGNVYEWTQDCYTGSYSRAPADGSAMESGDCFNRVIRGGSWFDGPEKLRSANRGTEWLGQPRHDVGFRVARRF